MERGILLIFHFAFAVITSFLVPFMFNARHSKKILAKFHPRGRNKQKLWFTFLFALGTCKPIEMFARYKKTANMQTFA